MPYLDNPTAHAAHPLASRIPWSVWKAFYCSATDTELRRLENTLEESASPLDTDNPLKALICTILGHMQTPPEELFSTICAMGTTPDTTKLRACALSGNTGLLRFFLSKLEAQSLADLLKEKGCDTFYLAAASGHTDTLRFLENLMTPAEIHAAIARTGFESYREAAVNGYTETLRYLERRMSAAEIQAAIAMDRHETYRWTARYGHTETLRHLENQMTEEQVHAAVTALCNDAFSTGRAIRHPAALTHFSQYPVFIESALLHETTAESPLHTFLNERVKAWRAAREAFIPGTPHGVFVLDEANAALALRVAFGLIRQNTEAATENLHFLLGIPSVAALAHTAVRNQENALVREALHLENREAITLLMALPGVRAHAETHNYYADTLEGTIDLRAIARDRESSMRALSADEERGLSLVREKYAELLSFIGTDNLLEALREDLRERYLADPAVVRMPDNRHVPLPLDWHEFESLRLPSEQHGEALRAYYQHPAHTALRWILKRNPWIASRADHVQRDLSTGEGYSVFATHSELIVLLWLAVSDDSAPPTGGHTLEGRIDNFFRELSLIGRAHNWHRLHTLVREDGSQTIEECDDLEGDKPSCSLGTRRRLFQSAIGHPLLHPFGIDVLEAALREFARQHFDTLITPVNLPLLRAAEKAFNKGVFLSEGQQAALRELDIPPEKIEAFIEHMRAQYASGWSGGHEYFLREKLNLQNPTLTHAVRLWVCVDFSGLLRSHSAASSSIATNAASRFFARGASASSSAQPPVKTPEPGG